MKKIISVLMVAVCLMMAAPAQAQSVSYTHLTLPTNRQV